MVCEWSLLLKLGASEMSISSFDLFANLALLSVTNA